jgi:SAM-dependent methyltransferase
VHDDRQRWNERYSAITNVDARAPQVLDGQPELESLLPTSGRCLDAASGPGAVTLWLAERGIDVTALDVSEVAIELLRSAATDRKVTHRVDARVADLDDGLPDDLHNLDLVVCQRFRDPAIWSVMIDRLSNGGIAVITVLSAVGCAAPGPFHAAAGELLTTFGSDERCHILHHREDDSVAHLIVRRC